MRVPPRLFTVCCIMPRSRSLVPTQSLCLTIRVAVYPHELRLSEFVETDSVWRRGMWGWDDFSKMREHVTRRTGNTDSRYVARESLSLRWQVYIHFSPQWDLPATSLWPCTLLSSGLCACTGMRYPHLLPDSRYEQPFSSFFIDCFYSSPVLPSNSSRSRTSSSLGVTEGLSQGKEQVARGSGG